ncbi:MAG: chemotaxis protein MotB [Elusimicrobia bacterium]|nr:MAG: chemotaxis protein MotB [Elusimicrobiota bacterium]KAF0154159.1 MAG: chemotaxis protein MotB [Elusimicrobiota bacterium]
MAVYKARRDDLENQLNKGALWAVTYGDLMSYLMIFFLVLFSFSVARNDKTKSRQYEESLANIQRAFGGQADSRGLERARAQEREDKLADKLAGSLKDKALNGMVTVESSELKVRLVLTEAILFASGRADLKERAREVLKPIALDLGGLPNEIVVEGHTDNLPIKSGPYRTNWELSMARAYAVVAYLEELGLDPKKLAGIGYGENRPAADNAAPEGRARNRRIEISLIKTE